MDEGKGWMSDLVAPCSTGARDLVQPKGGTSRRPPASLLQSRLARRGWALRSFNSTARKDVETGDLGPYDFGVFEILRHCRPPGAARVSSDALEDKVPMTSEESEPWKKFKPSGPHELGLCCGKW